MKIMRFLFISYLFFVPSLFARDTDELMQILTSGPLKGVDHSVAVVRVNDGSTLFEYHADEALTPASVTKLVIGVVALQKLSPVFTFSTDFYLTSGIHKGTVKGDMIVKGGGDPIFVSESMWQVASDLKRLGLKEISGNLVIDNSLFNGKARDTADRISAEKASSHAYDAPVTAFGTSFNTIPIAIAPGESLGMKARVDFDPYPIHGIEIINQVTTSARGSRDEIFISRLSDDKGGSKIMARGKIALGSPIKKFYRSASNPVQASGEMLRSFLLAFGITVNGSVVEGKVPPKAQLALSKESKDLFSIVRDLNLYSNNYIADVLLKRLGAEFKGDGSLVSGIQVIEDFLKKEVAIPGELRLVNASGLNPENKISAKQFVHILQYTAKNFRIFPEFIASLPIAGKSGTLKDRFDRIPGSALNGILRAKTGTLTEPVSTSTLVGYMDHPSMGLLAFAILQNGKQNQKQSAIADLHKSQERFLAACLKFL